MSIPAIVLAAGASRRLGRPKQLLELQGEPLVVRAIRIAQQAAAPVFVVLGAHEDKIRAQTPLQNAIVVSNPRWQEGISTSIQAGLLAVETIAPQARGVLLLTCDQPRLTAAHLVALIYAFDSESGIRVVASRYAGIDGVPAIFPRALFPALHALGGDTGARSLIAQATCPIVSLPFADGAIDIDSPADLAHLQ